MRCRRSLGRTTRGRAPDDRHVGDGSFGMSVGELETITRLNLPIVLMHFNNGTFGWIKELQHLYHERRYFSVDFNPVDYAAIARGFGLRAWQVPIRLISKARCRRRLADGGPCFIDMVTASQLTETPPVTPGSRPSPVEVRALTRRCARRDVDGATDAAGR